MNLRERLKEAYENVSFSADRTWTSAPNAYQKSNMELYLKEHHIQVDRLHRNRPRTVRECIPKSRLAQYANYVYNESREMSYASSTSNCDTTLAVRLPTEPWEMPEVGELYRWFLKNQPEDHFSRLEGQYESPLLNVTGFEDKIMKIQITEDRVKNIWNKDNLLGEARLKTSQLSVNLFTSPLKSIFLFNNESDYNHEWFRNISISKDFEQVERLSHTFKEESSAISKFLTGGTEPAPVPVAEPTSTEILYSEVLQGLSPSRKFLSSFKTDTRVATTDEASSVSQDSFTNYTVLNAQRAVQDEPSKSDNFNQKYTPQSDKFVPQKTSVYCQAGCKYPTNQFQVDSVPRQTRTFMVHPFSSSYVQQTYVYSPVQAMQRWVPSNFSNYYPTQVFTSSWFTQNPTLSNVSRIFGPHSVNTNSENKESDFNNRRFTDENQSKEEGADVEPCLEEHQVSTSISEELEIQALEQYSNSNENFYQELEKQAAEQYTSSPE